MSSDFEIKFANDLEECNRYLADPKLDLKAKAFVASFIAEERKRVERLRKKQQKTASVARQSGSQHDSI